ncbi:MAG: hypothetical protein L3J71_06290 [Victivallaceae bacterium]|nr:hypothetical protein [Victivallaceae bacterium]
MHKEKLTTKEQSKDRSYFSRFNIFNAISFGCLGENILYLFALALGSPAYIITILGSLMFLGNIGMPVGKKMVSSCGATGTLWRVWVIRNLAGAFIATAPFSAKISPSLGSATILIGALIFYLSRSAGIVTTQAIYHEITTPKNCGKYIASIFQNFSLFVLLTMGTIVLVMRHYASINTYQFIYVIGALAGIIGTWFVSRMIETQTPRISSRQPIMEAFRNVWQTERLKRLLFANCAAYTITVMTAPVSLLALKKIYLVSDETAMIFILIQIGGTIAVSYVSKIISAHSGPRPLVILYYSALIMVCLLWIMAPVKFNWLYIAATFFLIGLGGMGIPLSLTHYFQNAVPPKQSVGISLVIAVLAGLCAGALGGGISTALIKIIPYFHADVYTIYQNYFIINIGFALLGLVVIMRLKKIKDWEVKQVIGLFFAPRDIRTMMFLNKMNRSLVTLESEKDKIKKLGLLRSGLSEQELLNFMDSPKYELRYHAIWSLINIPLSDNGRQRLINELTDGLFSTANIAAHILGVRKITEAAPALKTALSSADLRLKGHAMVALTQLKQRNSYAEIIEIFNQANNPRLIINGATALTNIGSVEAITAMINKANQAELPRQVRREIIIAIAELGDISSEFYKFLKPGDEDTSNELDLFEALSSTSTDTSNLHELQPILDNENSNAEILTIMAKWLNSPCSELPKKVKKDDTKKHKKTFLNLAALEEDAPDAGPQDKLFSAINTFCANAKTDQNRELLICLLAICYVRNPSTRQ